MHTSIPLSRFRKDLPGSTTQQASQPDVNKESRAKSIVVSLTHSSFATITALHISKYEPKTSKERFKNSLATT